MLVDGTSSLISILGTTLLLHNVLPVKHQSNNLSSFWIWNQNQITLLKGKCESPVKSMIYLLRKRNKLTLILEWKFDKKKILTSMNRLFIIKPTQAKWLIRDSSKHKNHALPSQIQLTRITVKSLQDKTLHRTFTKRWHSARAFQTNENDKSWQDVHLATYIENEGGGGVRGWSIPGYL